MEFLAAGNAEFGDAIGSVRCGTLAMKDGSKGAEGVFGVVAGADGFGETGSAFGLQTGEENRGFDLGAGDGCVEVDGL